MRGEASICHLSVGAYIFCPRCAPWDPEYVDGTWKQAENQLWAVAETCHALQHERSCPTMTVEQLAADAAADGECRDCGYEPELKRTLGGFQVFAISFAFISVAVGVFGTYDNLLQSAGPVGIWLWVLAAVGQTLVALVVAQFAARIALSGSSYQWASRLANPKVGWFFGWLTFWALALGVVAMNNALASQALMPLFGMAPNENTARLITLALLVIETVLVIASTRLF